MQFFTLLGAALALTGVLGVQVSYDPTYDNATESLDTVECSDGSNGLITRGYTTFGSLPSFPYIGGASAISEYNSPACGTCWAISYNGTTIHFLAIDYAESGFNLGERAMNNLTHGQAVQLGIVNGSGKQVAASLCGL
jgi:hypothetical protein